MHLFYLPDMKPDTKFSELSDEEAKHCLRTLRLGKGSTVYVTNGKGLLNRCLITDAKPKTCTLEVIESKVASTERNFDIHIAAALTKNMNRMEFFIEKAVEMGIDKFTPLVCKHSERVRFNSDRFAKIAVSAMKQSQNLHLPEIVEPVDFKHFVEKQKLAEAQKFIAYQSDESAHLKEVCVPGKNVTVLIGPEGDFTDNEIQTAKQNGFIGVGLGKNRLRTETAALYACFAIIYQNI